MDIDHHGGDAALDRPRHNAHKIALEGESMRKAAGHLRSDYG